MNININYDRKSSEDKEVSNQELTYGYVTYATNTKYKDGLEGQKRRIWGRIQRKFDEAVDKDKSSLELETAEIDFIKDVFKDAKFPPQIAKFVVLLEDEVDALGKKAAKQ